MAPALTRVLKDDHGIHLSSPSGSVLSGSHGAPGHAELDPHLMLTEDADLQKMWLNVSLFSALDSCVPMSLDVPAIPALTPYMQASASQYEAVSPPSPSSLLGLLSFNKGLNDSHQGASVLSGVPDMFLGLTPEHSGQEASLQRGCGDAPECGPDGVDVHLSSLTHVSLAKSQDNTNIFAISPPETEEKRAGMGCLSAAKLHCNGRLNSDPLTPRASVEEALKEQLSRQARLHSRAWGLQKRLEAALAAHAVLHCNQQLEGLKMQSQLEDDSWDYIHSGLVPPPEDNKPNSSWLDLSSVSSSLTELREFCCSNQAVLRGLQESLDSDATASSSSDEELGERWSYRRTKRTFPISSNCERQWLEERAELGSRWGWLQLRLAELEGRIQQLVELHKHIRSSKSGVVLAEPQPLKDRKAQQNLLREMGGLSCTATDADTEPCSPMRLLHNIERQSAQLSQIVNSLMPPLSFSPQSKQAQAWKERSSIKRGQKADNGVMAGSTKRRKLGSRMLFKADVSCVCARTRPLVAYCKPRLFTFNTHNPSSSQESSGQFTLIPSSSLLPSTCLRGSSCDPAVFCSDPDCSSSWTLSSRNLSSSCQPVMPLSFVIPDMGSSYHMQRSMAREEWSQRPLFINNQSTVPSHYNRCSSTSLHNSHKYKQHARRHKSNVMGLSPIKRAGSALSQCRRAKQRKRKRKCIQQHIEEDEEDSLCHLYDLQESSDEFLEGSYTQASLKQDSKGFVRRRRGDSVYNIDNIVIPMSLAKVEKLQYKNILTPSWRIVDSYPLAESKEQKRGDCEEGQVEDLSDEVFAHRHSALEQREKLRWTSWGKRKCCRRPTRSGSSLSGTVGTICISGEESSVESSSAQLDTDEQPSSDEWLLRAPWEPRMFPLDKDKEETLLSYNLEKVPEERSVSNFAFSTSKDSNSHVSSVRSSGVLLPSGEQAWHTA